VGKFDHGSKRASDSDQRAFLKLVGCIEEGEQVEIRRLECEIVAGQRRADRLFKLRPLSGGGWRIEYIEDIIERAMLISLVPAHRKLPIRAWIIIMRETDMPKKWPPDFVRVRGRLKDTLEPEYVFIWRTPARRLFELGMPLVTLVPLSLHTEADMTEASDLLRTFGDEDLMSRFLMYARMVYSENDLRRLHVLFDNEVLELLSETKEGRKLRKKALLEGREQGVEKGMSQGMEKGIQKGIEKGIEKGLDHARAGIIEAIQQVVNSRFPTLSGSIGLSHLDYHKAQKALLKVLNAQTEDDLRQALN